MIDPLDYQDIVCILESAQIAVEAALFEMTKMRGILLSLNITAQRRAPIDNATYDEAILLNNGVNVIPEIKAFLVALQRHVIKYAGSLDNFITGNGIMVPAKTAALSSSLGFPIPTDHIGGVCQV